MKKEYSLIAVFVLCIFLFVGCSTITGSLTTQNTTTGASGESNSLLTIDPLGITEDLGTPVLDATANTEFIVDYMIIPKSDSYKYKYMHEAFELIGQNKYAYYSFYTPLNASLIQSTEYEVYYDGTKPDIFIQNFNKMYNTLCDKFETDSIYQMGYTPVSDPIENIKNLSLESIVDCFKTYENGTYYISWQGPEYLVHMQIILDNQNIDVQTGKPYYEVILAFDKSAFVQEMTADGTYEIDRNAILSSIDPLSFTWLDALGKDIGFLIDGKTEGTDYSKQVMPDADEDYAEGAHTHYKFLPYGVSIMGQQNNPYVIMVVPEGGGIFSFAYIATFSKDTVQDLERHTANFLVEYNNLCTLYGQPTRSSQTVKDGTQKSMPFEKMMSAIMNNEVGMYSCYWADTPNGNVFLDILNPSEKEDINGRLSFTE